MRSYDIFLFSACFSVMISILSMSGAFGAPVGTGAYGTGPVYSPDVSTLNVTSTNMARGSNTAISETLMYYAESGSTIGLMGALIQFLLNLVTGCYYPIKMWLCFGQGYCTYDVSSVYYCHCARIAWFFALPIAVTNMAAAASYLRGVVVEQ